MKLKVTKKDMKVDHNYILQIGYCNAEQLL